MLLAFVVAATGMAVVATPAYASHGEAVSSTCPSGSGGTGRVCLYYSPNFSNSKTGFYYAGTLHVHDYFSPFRTFLSSGAGQGTQVGNNAASVANFDRTYHVTVYYHANFGGHSVTMSTYPNSGYRRNLEPYGLRNDNRSHQRRNLSCPPIC